ncbi:EF-hand domain-containing protein [Solihabitans fulvus]|uniref:EF-hand domain-containing protein n=1 Tax=Solihabitans fulvus TaxID=1892852 RepID=A0A5B2XR60_9PSEU|nr:EF-hand domain-containing protein [Solihabitans fulvus]KAA2265371.1 EF-hand domain-containing protein [Solihabitans fulvus]
MSDADFLNAKINHGFDRLDVDGDGLLTEQDHVLMGQRVAGALGHALGSPQEQRITESFVRIWREVHAPHIPGGGATISREQFVASTTTLAVDPQARSVLGAIAETYLAVADTDGDGQVGLTEFRTFQRPLFPDLTDEAINEAFAHLDTNANGYLTTREFVDGLVEFWTSTDPAAPGNWWMGRPTYAE